jgi:hypothetical protein
MEARNTAESDSASENLLRAEHRSGNRCLRELDWKSLPCIELPRPSFCSDEWRRKQKLPAAKEFFEVQAVNWRLKSVETLPPALRPDPAFRRFHPIASGLLMLDDLGNAEGFGDSEAAVLRYDRAGRLAAKAGFAHRLFCSKEWRRKQMLPAAKSSKFRRLAGDLIGRKLSPTRYSSPRRPTGRFAPMTTTSDRFDARLSSKRRRFRHSVAASLSVTSG